MKESLRLLVLLVACVGMIWWWLPAPVFASTVEFEFTVRVTGIIDQTLLPNLTGGSVLTGRFSFDSSAPGQTLFLHYTEYLVGPPFTLTVQVESLTFTETVSKIIVINDLPSGTGTFLDRLFVRADGTLMGEYVEFYLDQRSTTLPTLLSSDALPVSELDLGLVNVFSTFGFTTEVLTISVERETGSDMFLDDECLFRLTLPTTSLLLASLWYQTPR